MSVDRCRLGCALPEAPARSRHSAALRGLVAGAALLGGILGSTGAGLSAQFPPPARPPKMAAEPSTPQDGAPAKLPSARSVLDKHLAAIGGRQAVLSHTSTRATGTISMPATGLNGAVEIYGAHPNRTLL